MRPLSSRLRFLPLTHAFDLLRAKRKIRDCSQSNTDSVSIIKIEPKARRHAQQVKEKKLNYWNLSQTDPSFGLFR